MTVTDNNNRISFNPDPEKSAAIEGFMGGLEESLGEIGVDLGTEDVRKFAVWSDGSSVYVKTALVLAQTVQGICPPHVDTVEFARDIAGAEYYDAMERRLNALAKLMHGASMLCRKEGYAQANAVYDGAKKAAEFNVPGAKAAADELGQNFANHGPSAAALSRKKAASEG